MVVPASRTSDNCLLREGDHLERSLQRSCSFDNRGLGMYHLPVPALPFPGSSPCLRSTPSTQMGPKRTEHIVFGRWVVSAAAAAAA